MGVYFLNCPYVHIFKVNNKLAFTTLWKRSWRWENRYYFFTWFISFKCIKHVWKWYIFISNVFKTPWRQHAWLYLTRAGVVILNSFSKKIPEVTHLSCFWTVPSIRVPSINQLLLVWHHLFRYLALGVKDSLPCLFRLTSTWLMAYDDFSKQEQSSQCLHPQEGEPLISKCPTLSGIYGAINFWAKKMFLYTI